MLLIEKLETQRFLQIWRFSHFSAQISCQQVCGQEKINNGREKAVKMSRLAPGHASDNILSSGNEASKTISSLSDGDLGLAIDRKYDSTLIAKRSGFSFLDNIRTISAFFS